MVQDNTINFEQNLFLFSAFTYVLGRPVLITHSRGAAFTVAFTVVL